MYIGETAYLLGMQHAQQGICNHATIGWPFGVSSHVRTELA